MIADDYIHCDYAPASANYTIYRHGNYGMGLVNIIKDYSNTGRITDSRMKKWFDELGIGFISFNDNMDAVAYMLDTTRWSEKFGNSTYADYAIGGPPLEMFKDSYNKRHSDQSIWLSANSRGYLVYDSYEMDGLYRNDPLYIISSTAKAGSYYIASPSAGGANNISYVFRVSYVGELRMTNFLSGSYSDRWNN